MDKSLEELEAERDALLQQVRNPEPPTIVDVTQITKERLEDVKEKLIKSDSDEETLETRKKKKTKKRQDLNGDVVVVKRMSESSTGGSSPNSQVGLFPRRLFFQSIN